MLLVSIDTSGRKGSVALCRGDAGSFETLQLAHLDGGTYSARLMPTIAELLEQRGFQKNDVEGFAVVSGPGSFTGLRVGLATVKGLCEVLNKPLATVSMLEALAILYGHSTATAAVDAGRGELYVGTYKSGNSVGEFIAKLAEFSGEARQLRSALITPDPAIADSLRSAGVDVKLVATVEADGIGRIGLRKLLAGDRADPATVDVNYIRRSDAEIFAKPKG